jgi:hypothetical protein
LLSFADSEDAISIARLERSQDPELHRAPLADRITERAVQTLDYGLPRLSRATTQKHLPSGLLVAQPARPVTARERRAP